MSQSLCEDSDTPEDDRDVLQMITLRSDGQFNTTVYSYDDRFRGIYGTRMVVLMHQNDIAYQQLTEGERVAITTAADDGVPRSMSGFRITEFNIPEGCVATYYPETNALIPLWHYADRSKVPAAKSVPVRISRDA